MPVRPSSLVTSAAGAALLLLVGVMPAATALPTSVAISSPSRAHASVTALPAPPKVSASPRDAAAAVYWWAPTGTASSRVTGYVVTAIPGYRTCRATATDRSCIVTGLRNNTAYAFVARALYSSGASALSPRTPYTVTPHRVPGPLRNLWVTAPTSSLALVTWQWPVVTGPLVVLGFAVRWGVDGDAVNWIAYPLDRSRRFVVAISPGHAYLVQLRAINDCGRGSVRTLTFHT